MDFSMCTPEASQSRTGISLLCKFSNLVHGSFLKEDEIQNTVTVNQISNSVAVHLNQLKQVFTGYLQNWVEKRSLYSLPSQLLSSYCLHPHPLMKNHRWVTVSHYKSFLNSSPLWDPDKRISCLLVDKIQASLVQVHASNTKPLESTCQGSQFSD